MTGYEYEEKCARLLETKGFIDVKVTPGSGDQGIDVLAKKDGKQYGIQCKYYEGVVGNKAVQEAFAGASYYDCSVAMVITNSTLTAPAKKLAEKLRVEVWEKVDAVYLRDNDANYQKKMEAQKEKWREEQRKREYEIQQKELYNFQRWQAAYKAVMTEREKRNQTDIVPIEQRCLERKSELLSQAHKQCEEISQTITALKAEQNELSANLASASWYQVSKKMQWKKRKEEISKQVQRMENDITAGQNKLASKSNQLEQEYKKEVEQLKQIIEKEAPLPNVPEVVFRFCTTLIIDRLVPKSKKLDQWSEVRERLKYQIWIDLCRSKKEITLQDIIQKLNHKISELYDLDTKYFSSLISSLIDERKITRKEIERYKIYYSAIDNTSFCNFENDAYNRLAEYTAIDINNGFDEEKKSATARTAMFKENEKKTKEISREYIAEYLAGEGRATLDDITKNLWNITGPYKNTLIYSCLHDLVREGRVVNRHRGGRSYYELRYK